MTCAAVIKGVADSPSTAQVSVFAGNCARPCQQGTIEDLADAAVASARQEQISGILQGPRLAGGHAPI